jgi:hypothetical protein
MKLKSKTLEYYEWSDIENYLSDQLGIEQRYFRDYHKIVGGRYKDFWHVWLNIVDENVHNGCYSPVFINIEEDEYLKNELIEKYGEWSLKLLDAINSLHNQLEEDMIVILYEW